jgi:hypothetical protein
VILLTLTPMSGFVMLIPSIGSIHSHWVIFLHTTKLSDVIVTCYTSRATSHAALFATRFCFVCHSFILKTTMHAISSSSSRAARRAAAKAARPVLARGAHKEIKFSNDGRASILKGVDVLANAVSVTLGPKGESHSRCPHL